MATTEVNKDILKDKASMEASTEANTDHHRTDTTRLHNSTSLTATLLPTTSKAINRPTTVTPKVDHTRVVRITGKVHKLVTTRAIITPFIPQDRVRTLPTTILGPISKRHRVSTRSRDNIQDLRAKRVKEASGRRYSVV